MTRLQRLLSLFVSFDGTDVEQDVHAVMYTDVDGGAVQMVPVMDADGKRVLRWIADPSAIQQPAPPAALPALPAPAGQATAMPPALPAFNPAGVGGL